MQKGSKKALADETDLLVNRIVECGADGIIAGFPCIDLSSGNPHGPGITGKFSGLFWELIKAIRLVDDILGKRPAILLENVATLFTRRGRWDMGIILGELASIRNYIEWDCVRAATVGAPHGRPRAYILAHTNEQREQRYFPEKISRQPEYGFLRDDEKFEDFIRRPDHGSPVLCRKDVRSAERVHAIGNGNPPCVIRELTKGLPP